MKPNDFDTNISIKHSKTFSTRMRILLFLALLMTGLISIVGNRQMYFLLHGIRYSFYVFFVVLYHCLKLLYQINLFLNRWSSVFR